MVVWCRFHRQHCVQSSYANLTRLFAVLQRRRHHWGVLIVPHQCSYQCQTTSCHTVPRGPVSMIVSIVRTSAVAIVLVLKVLHDVFMPISNHQLPELTARTSQLADVTETLQCSPYQGGSGGVAGSKPIEASAVQLEHLQLHHWLCISSSHNLTSFFANHWYLSTKYLFVQISSVYRPFHFWVKIW